MQAADGLLRLAGQRDVDAVGGQADVELGGLQLGAALLDQRLERLARLVGGPPDRAALLRRQVGHAAQQVGQLGLAPEVAHAQLLQRCAGAGLGDRGLGLGAQRSDAVQDAHAGGTLTVSDAAAGRAIATSAGLSRVSS